MSCPKHEMALQSFCLREVKCNKEVADKVKECGLHNIELCALHADFKDESCFEEVTGIYKTAGVKIISIGVQTFCNDPVTEEKYFKFAQMAGAKLISANFAIETVPACYRSVEKLADKYDINLAIHNHGGRHWLGSSQMLKHVLNNTSERIGLCLDTAWTLDAGEDPVQLVEIFADRLYSLHLKDFIFNRARKPEDVVVGEGNLDLNKLFASLKTIDFQGQLILEYEGDPADPIPAIKQCVEAVNNVKQ